MINLFKKKEAEQKIQFITDQVCLGNHQIQWKTEKYYDEGFQIKQMLAIKLSGNGNDHSDSLMILWERIK